MKNLSVIHSAVIVSAIILFFTFGTYSKNEKIRDLLFLFPSSYLENANHKNTACHDYAYNLMRTAEPNSIFMTEGGDNQVFSLLYFSYCERKRPDVDFYDQKGNVFPRLYGDLMNIYPDDLAVIRELRDFQLYSTSRPVYLTWPREGMHNLCPEFFPALVAQVKQQAQQANRPIQDWRLNSLSEIERALDVMVPTATFDARMKNGEPLNQQHLKYLGPWYLKMYGLVYKVMPIRYAVLEGLERYNETDATTLIAFVNRERKRNQRETFFDAQMDKIIERDFPLYVNQLIEEKYVARTAKGFKMIRPLDLPFENIDAEGYWENYTFDYTNVANAPYWDFLTREIFNNYGTLRSAFAAEQFERYSEKAKHFPEDSLKYQMVARKYQKEIADAYKRALPYASGNPAVYFNYASTLMRNGDNAQALSNYLRAAYENKDMFSAWVNAARIHYGMIQPTIDETELLSGFKEIMTYLNNAEKALLLVQKKSGREKEMTKTREYQEIDSFRKKIQGEIDIPRSKILEQQRKAGDNPNELLVLASMYERRLDLQEALEIYNRIALSNPQDVNPLFKMYGLFNSVGDQVQALSILERVVTSYSSFKNVDPNGRWQVIDSIVRGYMEYAINLANGGKLGESLQLLQRAKSYITLFYQDSAISKDPTIAARRAQIQEIEKQAENIVQQINAYLSRK